MNIWANCDNCKHDKGCEEYCSDCLATRPPSKWKAAENYRPPTNAERIRAMSDEELAEWIHNGISSDACDFCGQNNGYCDGTPCRGKAEAEVIVEWLKRPVEMTGEGC